MAYTTGHDERDALNAYLEQDRLTLDEKATLAALAASILHHQHNGWTTYDAETEGAIGDDSEEYHPAPIISVAALRYATVRDVLLNAEDRACTVFDETQEWQGDEAFGDLRTLVPEITDADWSALVALNFDGAAHHLVPA